jgi:hypothetical protein
MSRRSASLIPLAVAFALIAVACGSDAGNATTTTAAGTTTTAQAATSSAPTTEAPTTTGEVTTSSEAPPSPSGAVFAITEVAFGTGGYVEITNLGDVEASLDGFWLCQQPSYNELAGPVGPGETVRVPAASSSYGSLNADGGALGLYTERDFPNPDAIIGYVAWGASGHGRIGVAVEAGVWTEGSSVDSSGASLITATEPGATSATGWTTG